MTDRLLQAVRTGIWLYAGTVETAVRILQSNVAFGTGDYEDEPEEAHDRPGLCFYVDWAEAGGTTGGSYVGPFSSLEEAEHYVAKASYGTVQWHAAREQGPS